MHPDRKYNLTARPACAPSPLFRAEELALGRNLLSGLERSDKTREDTHTGHPAAHALARYRCFLPDLAGLAGLRRAGPGVFNSNIIISFSGFPGYVGSSARGLRFAGPANSATIKQC